VRLAFEACLAVPLECLVDVVSAGRQHEADVVRGEFEAIEQRGPG
jgi:hypothetical protein